MTYLPPKHVFFFVLDKAICSAGDRSLARCCHKYRRRCIFRESQTAGAVFCRSSSTESTYQSLFTLVEGTGRRLAATLAWWRPSWRTRVAAAPVKSWEMKRRRLIALQEVHNMVSKCTQLSGLPVRKWRMPGSRRAERGSLCSACAI